MADGVIDMLTRVADGDHRAVDALAESVYAELRAMAQAYLRHESPNQTLQATALVHEAYLKLVDQRAARWQDRAHFMAVAAQAMRRILIDRARGRGRLKRGGAGQRLELDSQSLANLEQSVDLLALDEAIQHLATVNPQAAKVVEMRFFGGLTIEETAAVLEISDTGVERHWRYARAWLYRELTDGDSSAGGGDGCQ